MKNISEKFLFIISIVLVAVFGVSLNNKMVSGMNNLSNQVDSLSATVNDQNQQINSLYLRIEDLLEKQASIIDSYDIIYGAFNSEDMTYQVSLKATPKESTDRTTASVTLGDLKCNMSRSAGAFTAVIDVPVTKELSPVLTFYEDGTSKTETLNDVISFKTNFIYQIKSGFSGEKSYRDKQLRYDGKVILFLTPRKDSAAKSGRLFAVINDKEVWAEEIPVDTQNESDIKFGETFPVNPGDKFALFAEIKDNSGLTYRYPVDSTVISPNGRSLSENYMPGECTVYDKQGREIKFD